MKQCYYSFLIRILNKRKILLALQEQTGVLNLGLPQIKREIENQCCGLFQEHYGDFDYGSDYESMTVRGLANESGMISGVVVKAIKFLPRPESILLAGENNAVKPRYEEVCGLKRDNIFTVGLSDNVDYQWNFEEDPPEIPLMECIISQAILEHLLDPYKHVKDLWKLLKKGGMLHLYTVIPGFQYHRYPVDCLRFYPDWFEETAKRLGAEIAYKYLGIGETKIYYVFKKP